MRLGQAGVVAVVACSLAALAGCAGDGGDASEIALSSEEAAQILEGTNLYGEPLRSPDVTRVVENPDGRFSVFVDNGGEPDLCFHVRLFDDGWSYAKCRN